jgi:predicted enzyme involved in methoxymalonyl-ACP biosynthesis
VTSTVHCQVFVSDCDHTLWNGIVSEDGVHGLKFSAPYLELQRKLSELQKALFVGQLLGKTVKTSGVLLRPRKEYGFV